MNPRSIAIVLLTAGITLASLAAPAAACSPSHFDTPYDLFDEAVTVAVMKVDRVSKHEAKLSFVEGLKGSPDAKLELRVGLDSTCSPSIGKKGQRGVVYLRTDGTLLGLYDGFESDATVIDALRKYAAATTAAERAAPLLELVLGRAHSPAYKAGYALANRVELVQALDVDQRERILTRLEKMTTPSHLPIVAARLHDPRVAAIQDKRKFEDLGALDGVLAGSFDAESDPERLADVIAASSSSRSDRVAAMERCEQLRGKPLAELTIYGYAGMDMRDAEWTAHASACRSGTPVP